MRNTEEIWRIVDTHQDDFIALSDRVWEMPELCYTEFRSCAEHTAMLEAKGFRVTREVAGIPTAVMGEAGEDGAQLDVVEPEPTEALRQVLARYPAEHSLHACKSLNRMKACSPFVGV